MPDAPGSPPSVRWTTGAPLGPRGGGTPVAGSHRGLVRVQAPEPGPFAPGPETSPPTPVPPPSGTEPVPSLGGRAGRPRPDAPGSAPPPRPDGGDAADRRLPRLDLPRDRAGRTRGPGGPIAAIHERLGALRRRVTPTVSLAPERRRRSGWSGAASPMFLPRTPGPLTSLAAAATGLRARLGALAPSVSRRSSGGGVAGRAPALRAPASTLHRRRGTTAAPRGSEPVFLPPPEGGAAPPPPQTGAPGGPPGPRVRGDEGSGDDPGSRWATLSLPTPRGRISLPWSRRGRQVTTASSPSEKVFLRGGTTPTEGGRTDTEGPPPPLPPRVAGRDRGDRVAPEPTPTGRTRSGARGAPPPETSRRTTTPPRDERAPETGAERGARGLESLAEAELVELLSAMLAGRGVGGELLRRVSSLLDQHERHRRMRDW